MMMYYPIMLDVSGRLAVVIGGGAVAEQKVRELAASGARVRVVAPQLTAALAELAGAGSIEWLRRAYQSGDLRGARIAIAATADTAVNQGVWEEAEAAGVLLNAVDDVERCHYIAPSVHRAGDVTIAVSTAGRCPALAVRLRERVARMVGREHAEFARLAGALRPEVARRVPSLARRRALWHRLVDSPAIEALRAGDREAAATIAETLIQEEEYDQAARHGR